MTRGGGALRATALQAAGQEMDRGTGGARHIVCREMRETQIKNREIGRKSRDGDTRTARSVVHTTCPPPPVQRPLLDKASAAYSPPTVWLQWTTRKYIRRPQHVKRKLT